MIYVSAGVTHIPRTWVAALEIGGRLALPLTPTGALGCMLLITRLSTERYAARSLSPAQFVPCVGGNEPSASHALVEAFQSQGPDAVRSLRLRTPPDGTAWCVGDGWWLSTIDP